MGVVKNGTKKNNLHFSCTLLQIFAGILSLCLKSEIMDGFWSSRCLNDPVDLPDKIGSFLSGAATSMVVKNGTKKNFSPKIQKNKGSSNKKKLENRPPPKVGILILDPISKFSKVKNETQKRPPKKKKKKNQKKPPKKKKKKKKKKKS